MEYFQVVSMLLQIIQQAVGVPEAAPHAAAARAHLLALKAQHPKVQPEPTTAAPAYEPTDFDKQVPPLTEGAPIVPNEGDSDVQRRI